MATAWSGKRVAVVTRLAESDVAGLDVLRRAGIDVFVTHTPETTRHTAYHLSEDVDQRRVVLEASAGAYTLRDLPDIEPAFVHLAGLTDQEFSLAFMSRLKSRGLPFSVDMQGLVRQADLKTGEVEYADVPDKRRIAELADKMKLDAVEAAMLTGTGDLEEAAVMIEAWGTPETMITRSDGVLVRCAGKTYFESFSNSGIEGRTGRGDTTFGSYLARRLDHDVAESIRFAAAVASIKLERAGPFTGTAEEVLERLQAPS
jgi:sugar/nucleoside kinase (ribokinase family)